MTKKFKLSRRQTLAGLGGVALAGAAGSFSFPHIARSQAKLEKMNILMGTTPQFSSVVVAQENGHFKKQGLDTEITVFASGSVATEAFLTGQGGVVVAGDMPSLKLWQKGLIGVSNQASYSELSLIVARKSMTKPADFKGKKVGVLLGSTSEYLAGKFFASGNMTLKDVDVVNLRPAEMVTGLASGDIDAFVIWQPFGWRAVEAIKDVHVVTTAKPYFNEYQMVTSRREYTDKHEAELVAFIKGLREASQWTKQNAEPASKMVATFLRMDKPDLAKQMIDLMDYTVAYTKKFRQDMDALGKFANVPIDWNKMFEPKYLQKVDAALVEA